MSGLTYADGNFPFCVAPAFGEWDGSTFFSGNGEPSMAADAYEPAVGPGTSYPVGFTLEQAAVLYWRVKAWQVTCALECSSGGDTTDSDLPFPLIMDNDAAQWPWDGSVPPSLRPDVHGDLVCERVLPLELYLPASSFGGGPFNRVAHGSSVNRSATYEFQVTWFDNQASRSSRALAWDGKVWPHLTARFLFGVDFYSRPATDDTASHLYLNSIGSRVTQNGQASFFGEDPPVWDIWEGPAPGTVYLNCADDLSNDPTACVLRVRWDGLPDTDIPLFATSESYVPPGLSGHVLVEPYRYHDYGGIYDEATGLPL